MAKSLSNTVGGNIVHKTSSGKGKTKFVQNTFEDVCKSKKKEEEKILSVRR
jgi:hypothetical protein